MSIYRNALLCIAFVLALAAAANAGGCTFASDGDSYDFSSMTNETQYSFNIGGGLGGIKYYWNICAKAYTCSLSSTGLQPTTAACQYNGVYNSLGLVDSGIFSALASGKKGAKLLYTDQTLSCVGKTVARRAEIDLQCVPNAPTTVVSVGENPTSPCLYQMVMTSGMACPGAGGSSGGGSGKHGIGGGWIFIIILVCTATVYIAAGMLINFKVRGLQGKEMFPNYAFWSDLPGLMKDGVFYIKGKITGTGSTSGYQQV